MEIYTDQSKKPLLKNLIEPTRKFFLQLGNYTLILISVGCGFFISRYYSEIFNKKEADHMFVTPAKSVSVAISQNNELIILDRKSKSMVIYQDTVGINIFKLYANQIAKSANQ
jgi:hypothetical protein